MSFRRFYQRIWCRSQLNLWFITSLIVFQCNKITCAQCGTMSCYNCRQIITGYEHYNGGDPNGNGANKFSLKVLISIHVVRGVETFVR